MRLICGLFSLDEAPASETLLRAMAAQMDVPRLRPRLTLWREGPVGLAVLDFAALDGSATELPQDSSCILAADVRLDEPDVLARRLDCDPRRPDDDLLLAALRRFGPSGLERVLGDFAFASWDRQAGRLLCGRDAFGVRPLAYVHRPGQIFAFASLPNALHGAGIVPKRVDEDTLARRIAGHLRADDSLIAGIKRLPPAHVIEVSRDGVLLNSYWQLNRAAAGTRQCSPEEAAREMRRLVAEAVRCRLPRAGEIGAQLSGGLDSPAIAVLAARQLREQGRRLHAYSFLDRERNDVTLADESEFIKTVAQQEPNIEWTPLHRKVASSLGDYAIDADTMMVRSDKPDDLYTRAEAHGVGLILSGWGGDEGSSFNGRGALAELFLRGRWKALAREISARGRRGGNSRLRIFRGEVFNYLWSNLPPAAMLRLIKLSTGKSQDIGALFRRSLSSAARHRIATGETHLQMAADGCENRWRLLTSPHIALRTELHAQIGARHGLAFAFPLLDRRVVEFALSLPSELFVRDGRRRVVFRDAMADVLPDKVRLEERKLAAFPSMTIDNVARRDDILAQIDAYEKIPIIRRTIDLAWLRQQVERFPSADEVREELRAGRRPAAEIAAAMHGLAAAAYLARHGGE